VIHTYLSPHLDDAALSCGGAIHRHTAAGGTVLVVTIFAGEADTETELSPFAQVQHGYWGNPPWPMALRRAEVSAAMVLLGASARHLKHLDAVYRTGTNGQWLYPDLSAIFGSIHPDDPTASDGARRLSQQLAGLIPRQGPEQLVFAPLGLGCHVDHQITHSAALRLWELGYRVAFYEDFPYVEQSGTDRACAPVEGWRDKRVTLDGADVEAKVAALRYYQTQLHVLFGQSEEMPHRVRAFAAARSPGSGYAERVWWPEELSDV
jgi:LmbE family N-acetylglucosaminyl deacetylase